LLIIRASDGPRRRRTHARTRTRARRHHDDAHPSHFCTGAEKKYQFTKPAPRAGHWQDAFAHWHTVKALPPTESRPRATLSLGGGLIYSPGCCKNIPFSQLDEARGAPRSASEANQRIGPGRIIGSPSDCSSCSNDRDAHCLSRRACSGETAQRSKSLQVLFGPSGCDLECVSVSRAGRKQCEPDGDSRASRKAATE
jgi:hypothetical protein